MAWCVFTSVDMKFPVRNSILLAVSVLALSACQKPSEHTASATPVTPNTPQTPATPTALPTGTFEGTVTLTAPIPAARPVAIDAENSRRPGCAAAASNYYANIFGITTPGVLPEALVTLDAHTTTRPPARRRFAYYQDCSIKPRILAMALGDELVLRSETDQYQLPKVDGQGATIAQLLQRSEDQVKTLAHPGRYILHSVNFPNWMQTPLVVTPNPFYDQTNPQGHFRIENVPAGTFTAHAWFPGATPVDVSVTIRAGETTQQNFSITPLPADQIRPNQPEAIDAGPVIP
jgi:hypothetical protein